MLFFLRPLLAGVLVFALPAASQDSVSSQIVALVGDEIITEQDVHTRTKFIPLMNPDISPTREMALDQLVEESVKIDAAKQVQVKPTTEDVDIIRKQVLERVGIQNKNYKEFFQNNDISIESVERYVYVNAIWSKMVYGVYGKNIAPTDLDMQNATEDYIRKVRRMSEWEVAMLSVSKKQANFQTILSQVNERLNPQNFETLASKFSSDASRIRGGYLGWRTPEDVQVTLALESTKAGNVSDPVEVGGEVVFFKVYSKRRALPPVEIDWGEIYLLQGQEAETISWLRRTVRDCYDLADAEVGAIFENAVLSEVKEPPASILAALRKNQLSKPQVALEGGIVIYMVCDKKLPPELVRGVRNRISFRKEQLYNKRLYKDFYGKVKIVFPDKG